MPPLYDFDILYNFIRQKSNIFSYLLYPYLSPREKVFHLNNKILLKIIF